MAICQKTEYMKKKILFIIWSFSYGGGAEALLTMIVNHLDPQKYEIGILEYYHAEIKKEPIHETITYLGAITFAGDAEGRKKYYYLLNEPSRMISRYIPQDYDLYIAFNYQIPCFLLPPGKRCIAWIHSDIYDLQSPAMAKYLMLQNQAFQKVQTIVSISDLTTKSLQELCPAHADKLLEIYNGVDTEQIRKKAAEYTAIRLQHPNLLFAGRLEKRKNPMRLVHILDLLHQRGKHIHLYYLGQGELQTEIREAAEGRGLGGYVHFTGYLQNPYPVMAQCDVNCLLSESEGFSISLLEGTALGKPFVSSRIGGAMILSAGGSCGTVTETDIQAAEAVADWLERDRDKIREDCATCIKRFALPGYINRIEALLDTVLSAPVRISSSYVYDPDAELDEPAYYYQFPSEYIHMEEKMILYGAGIVGTDYWRFLQKTHYCELVAWVDREYETWQKEGKRVLPITAVQGVRYDRILIANANKKTADIIRGDLEQLGVPGEKIVWVQPDYIG